MPTRAPIPCTFPGCPNLATRRGRCDQHRRRPSPSNATRDYGEQQRRAQAVRAWVREHGSTCPGWRREPHPADDLVADHVDPIGAGGDPRGALAVLCRSCNARKRTWGPTPPTGGGDAVN